MHNYTAQYSIIRELLVTRVLLVVMVLLVLR